MPPKNTEVTPPAACPDEYKTLMGPLISCEAASTMAQFKIPWYIIKQSVTQEYTSNKELAERWMDKAEARSKSAEDLAFRTEDDPKYTEDKVKLYALRVSHAVEEALGKKKNTLAYELEQLPKEKRSIQEKDRRTLLSQVQILHSVPQDDLPNRGQQGSDKYLALQYLEISRGHIGDFDITRIAPWKTDHKLHNKTTNKRSNETDAQGYTKVTEEEFTPPPKDMDQWKATMLIFRWTLLMALSAFPEQKLLQITKKELDNYYKWLYGEQIATRPNNPPTLGKLRWAERQAWSKITDILWDEQDQGTTLPGAITKVQGMTLWWNALLSNSDGPRDTYYKKGQGKDKNKDTRDWKGKGSGKDKSKSTKNKSRNTKGAKNQTYVNRLTNHPAPPAPATGYTAHDRPPPCTNPIKCALRDFTQQETAQGKPFCKNFHLRKCGGGCGRSHNCPFESNGKVCGKRPGGCNHRFQ